MISRNVRLRFQACRGKKQVKEYARETGGTGGTLATSSRAKEERTAQVIQLFNWLPSRSRVPDNKSRFVRSFRQFLFRRWPSKASGDYPLRSCCEKETRVLLSFPLSLVFFSYFHRDYQSYKQVVLARAIRSEPCEFYPGEESDFKLNHDGT